MKTFEVTDEQYAYVQQLRAALSDQVVGKYGHVRDRDALQFLIDNLDDELEVEADFDPSGDVDLDPAEMSSDAFDANDLSVGPGDGPGDATPEEVSYDEETDTASPDVTDEDDDSDDDDSDDEVGEEAPDVEDPAEEGDDPAEEDDEAGSDDGGDAGDGSASDDDMLDRMMNLLDTHDDKWEESSKADYRYRVELPDGSSEHVQTKDDVRALLFQNY